MNSKHITNFISKCFGTIASKKFPKPVQLLINKMYVFFMKVDMSEFDRAGSYETLNSLFTRELARKRRFGDNPDYFISPTDSFITEQGELNKDILLQIKGMKYSVKNLLTSKADHIDKVLNGNYINFYLSPKDYHRYHAPTSFKVKKLIHVPGKLCPVNNRYLKKKINLFIENERIIIECEYKTGNIFYMVLVGALNVGKMVIEFEPKVETNNKSDSVALYEYKNKFITKGDCLGYFKMGSTVVIISEKDFLHIKTSRNQTIRFGDVIAEVKKTSNTFFPR